MNNLAVFLSPQPADTKDGTLFLAGLAEDERANPLSGSIPSLTALLPPLWEGKFKEHLFPIEGLDGYFNREGLRAQGRSYLALLESDLKENDPFNFGHVQINHNSVLVWKNEDGSYGYFHCRECCMAILKWMTEGQEAWQRPLN